MLFAISFNNILDFDYPLEISIPFQPPNIGDYNLFSHPIKYKGLNENRYCVEC